MNIASGTLPLPYSVPTCNFYRPVTNIYTRSFYRVPEHDIVIARKHFTRRDILWQLPCSGTPQKGQKNRSLLPPALSHFGIHYNIYIYIYIYIYICVCMCVCVCVCVPNTRTSNDKTAQLRPLRTRTEGIFIHNYSSKLITALLTTTSYRWTPLCLHT